MTRFSRLRKALSAAPSLQQHMIAKSTRSHEGMSRRLDDMHAAKFLQILLETVEYGRKHHLLAYFVCITLRRCRLTAQREASTGRFHRRQHCSVSMWKTTTCAA